MGSCITTNKVIPAEEKLIHQAKSKLLLSKSRLRYKLNIELEKKQVKESELEKAAKAGNKDLAKLHARDLLNIEHFQYVANSMHSYIDHILSNIGFLNHSEVHPTIHQELSSLIYCSIHLIIEELEQFKDLIKKKYGKAAIDRALNDWDGKIFEDIITKIKNRTITDLDATEKLLEICQEKKFELII